MGRVPLALTRIVDAALTVSPTESGLAGHSPTRGRVTGCDGVDDVDAAIDLDVYAYIKAVGSAGEPVALRCDSRYGYRVRPYCEAVKRHLR